MRSRNLLIAAAILILAMLACGGSGTYKTTQRSSGNVGHIEVSAESADGTTTHDAEIDEEYDEEPVDLSATVEVQAGTCRVEFLDDFGSVVFALDASPGQPASGSGSVTTDDEGNISYRVTAENAQGVRIIIDYEMY
jgi:hypothetical protein